MPVHIGIDVGKTNLRITTSDPEQPVIRMSTADVRQAQAELVAQLRELQAKHLIQSVGISIFGPLQVDPEKPDYGAIIESSEPAWSGVNIPELVADTLQGEVYFDFDVNAGALAMASLRSESEYATTNFVYLSIGTGIGASSFRHGYRPGYAPQLGHMFIPREPDDLSFAGSCRFHGTCLQGLASGKALFERWGTSAEDLPDDHPAWDLESRYLARACANLVYSFAPDLIILGSSVGSSARLRVSEVERQTRSILNNFIEPGLRRVYSARPIVVGTIFGATASLAGAKQLGQNKMGLRLIPRHRA